MPRESPACRPTWCPRSGPRGGGGGSWHAPSLSPQPHWPHHCALSPLALSPHKPSHPTNLLAPHSRLSATACLLPRFAHSLTPNPVPRARAYPTQPLSTRPSPPPSPPPPYQILRTAFRAFDAFVKSHLPPLPDWSAAPIPLRRPWVFYVGHAASFAVHVCATESAGAHALDAPFARGIDPDVADPARCHAHPAPPTAWPGAREVLAYVQHVRTMYF